MRNKHFLPFHKQISTLESYVPCFSANAFNFDKSKIFLFGRELTLPCDDFLKISKSKVSADFSPMAVKTLNRMVEFSPV